MINSILNLNLEMRDPHPESNRIHQEPSEKKGREKGKDGILVIELLLSRACGGSPEAFRDQGLEHCLCVPFAPGVVQTEANANDAFKPASEWAPESVPFLLSLTPEQHSGTSVAMPGWYGPAYKSTWVIQEEMRLSGGSAPGVGGFFCDLLGQCRELIFCSSR